MGKKGKLSRIQFHTNCKLFSVFFVIHCSFRSDSNRNLYTSLSVLYVYVCVGVSVCVCVSECVLVARCLCLKNDVRQVVRPCLGAHLVFMYNFSLLIVDLLGLLVA